MLRPLDRVRDEKTKKAEGEHRKRVQRPGLLASRVDAAQTVEESLEPAEHRGERLPISLEDAEHVRAERLRQREH